METLSAPPALTNHTLCDRSCRDRDRRDGLVPWLGPTVQREREDTTLPEPPTDHHTNTVFYEYILLLVGYFISLNGDNRAENHELLRCHPITVNELTRIVSYPSISILNSKVYNICIRTSVVLGRRHGHRPPAIDRGGRSAAWRSAQTIPMKRAIHVALAALMLLGVVTAGAAPVAASGTDVTHDDDNCGVDNDDIDIDDSSNVIIDDSEDNDLLDLGLDIL